MLRVLCPVVRWWRVRRFALSTSRSSVKKYGDLSEKRRTTVTVGGMTQLWQHNRGNYTTPKQFFKKKKRICGAPRESTLDAVPQFQNALIGLLIGALLTPARTKIWALKSNVSL